MKKYILLCIALCTVTPIIIEARKASSHRKNSLMKKVNPNMIAVMAALKKRTLDQMHNAG